MIKFVLPASGTPYLGIFYEESVTGKFVEIHSPGFLVACAFTTVGARAIFSVEPLFPDHPTTRYNPIASLTGS